MRKQTPEVSQATDNEVRMSFHRMCERIAMTFIRCTAAVLCTALTASAANPQASSTQAPTSCWKVTTFLQPSKDC